MGTLFQHLSFVLLVMLMAAARTELVQIPSPPNPSNSPASTPILEQISPESQTSLASLQSDIELDRVTFDEDNILQENSSSKARMNTSTLTTPSGYTQHKEVDQSSPFAMVKHQAKKILNSSELCWNETLESLPDCSNYSHIYLVNINFSSPCYFSCQYMPTKLWPIHLEVHLQYKHPARHPTFITAQQTFNLSTWTLPITFPALGDDQKFFSLAATLCPPWDWHEHPEETVSLRLSTESPNTVYMQVSLKPDENFELVKTSNETVTASPASPWLRLYRWQHEEQSVLVTADVGDKDSSKVCAVLMVQNARCPARFDVSSLMSVGTRYQTFTARAGLVAHRDQFPDGLFIMVRSLPDDMPCTLNFSARSNRTTRKKSVVLRVWDHGSFWSSWYIFLVTGAGVVGLTIAITVATLFCIDKNVTMKKSSDDDEHPLMNESGNSSSVHVEYGGGILFAGSGSGSQNTHSSTPSAPGMGVYQPPGIGEGIGAGIGEGVRGIDGGLLGLGEDEEASRPAGEGLPQIEGVGGGAAYPPPATYAPPVSLMNFSVPKLNPQYVWWWKRVAVFNLGTADAQLAEVGFQNNLVIMGIFTALPTTEILRSYLMMLMTHGIEDRCYFNSRCLTGLGKMMDVSRVFTNIGYICMGVAFVIIVGRHQRLTHRILDNFTAENSVGVSRHYGLFMSMGYGLVIQGLMSSLYHFCPNSVTIRFDMMFMYVLLAVCVVNVWGLRHGDVTHHVYPTTVGVGVALLVAELREWMSYGEFWGLLTILYAAILISNTILMARTGIWSFSPYKIWKAWKGWGEVAHKLYEVLEQRDRTSTPLQVGRVLIGVVGNLTLMVCGVALDPNVYNFILIVCLVNTSIYFLNYVVTKRVGYKEKGTLLAWFCLALSAVLWIPALFAFFKHSTDSEASPSASRAMNTPCDFLGVFDFHDLWHLSSAFSLFFFFIGLLTLDDDLCYTKSKDIHVF